MKKRRKKKHKNRKDKIYVGTLVEVCNSGARDFNGWKGIVKHIDWDSRPVEYGVTLLWGPNGSSTCHYHGFPRKRLKTIKIRSKKGKT